MKSIIVYVILSNILINLTGDEYKKYIRVCTGFILIILIVSPVLNILNIIEVYEFNYDNMMKEITASNSFSNDYIEDSNELIYQKMEETLKTELQSLLPDRYEIKNVEFTVNEETFEEKIEVEITTASASDLEKGLVAQNIKAKYDMDNMEIYFKP